MPCGADAGALCRVGVVVAVLSRRAAAAGQGEAEPTGGAQRTTVLTVRSVIAAKPPGILMQTVALVGGKPEIVFNDSSADVSFIFTATVKRLGLTVTPTQ